MAATSGSSIWLTTRAIARHGAANDSAPPMVIALYKQLGLRGFGRRPRLAAAVLGPHEWGLRVLADHLGMSATTLNNWCHRGWVHHRKMPGLKGCLIIWADAGELEPRSAGCTLFVPSMLPLPIPPSSRGRDHGPESMQFPRPGRTTPRNLSFPPAPGRDRPPQAFDRAMDETPRSIQRIT